MPDIHTSQNQEGLAMSEKIRFRLVGGQNPLMLVPVCVDGRGPYQFILDTGASHCLLSQELSGTLGIQPEVEKQAMGAGGPVKIMFAHVSSMTVGSARRENVKVAITNEVQRIASAIQSKVDGVLGFEFLKDFILVIEYRECAFGLSLPSERVDRNSTRSGTSISFKLASTSKPLILVPAVVDGQGPFQFALDTGASRTMLSIELARKLAIQTADDRPVTGGGGQIKILAGKVSSLVVGGAAVRDHAIGAGEFLNMLSKAVGTELDGILGYNFLNGFKVTINYPHSRLELVPAMSP
jgi:predicted aspartyl protease